MGASIILGNGKQNQLCLKCVQLKLPRQVYVPLCSVQPRSAEGPAFLHARQNARQKSPSSSASQRRTWGALMHERSTGLGPIDKGPMLTNGARPMIPPNDTQFIRPKFTCTGNRSQQDNAAVSKREETWPTSFVEAFQAYLHTALRNILIPAFNQACVDLIKKYRL